MVSVTVTGAPLVTLLYPEIVRKKQLSVSPKEGNNKVSFKYTDSLGRIHWSPSGKLKGYSHPSGTNPVYAPVLIIDFYTLSKVLSNSQSKPKSLSVLKISN